jgi:hypothetical protein
MKLSIRILPLESKQTSHFFFYIIIIIIIIIIINLLVNNYILDPRSCNVGGDSSSAKFWLPK